MQKNRKIQFQPIRMKAIRVLKQGEKTVLDKIDIPSISGQKSKVLIRNTFAGVNYIDTYYQSGLYRVETPFTLGSDGSGIIEQVGDDVKQFRKGDRVAYYTTSLGSFAEYIAVEEKDVVSVPSEISLDIACASMVQGMTAHYLSHDTYSIKNGDTVLIHACTGGTGSLLVQLAKIRGASVIGTVGSGEKIPLAKALGVDHVINYSSLDFEQEVTKITNGILCHAVYDGVGKSTWEKSLKCVKSRGILVVFGNASGAIPQFDPLLLSRYGSIYLTRPKLGDYVSTRQEFEQRAQDVFKYISKGQLKVEIHKTFETDQYEQALQEIQSRNTRGKILIKM